MSLIAQNLHIGFSQKVDAVALQTNINFRLTEGEIVLLAGPNGVGKSVFLKTLIGMIPALRGSLAFHANPINILEKETRPWVSLMLATPPKVDLLNPLQMVLSAKPHHGFFSSLTAKDKSQALEALDFCDIKHLADKPFRLLSDGEKQKVMLARCLFQQTPVVLLDEPTAFLDHPSKMEFWNRIQTQAREQQTMFIVCSHDIHIALPHVNRVWLMNQNHFQEFADPANFDISNIMPKHGIYG